LRHQENDIAGLEDVADFWNMDLETSDLTNGDDLESSPPPARKPVKPGGSWCSGNNYYVSNNLQTDRILPL